MNEYTLQIEKSRKDYLTSEIERLEREYVSKLESKSIFNIFILDKIYNKIYKLKEELKYTNYQIDSIFWENFFNNPQILQKYLDDKFKNSGLREAWHPKCDKPKKVKGHPKKEKKTRFQSILPLEVVKLVKLCSCMNFTQKSKPIHKNDFFC